MIPTQLISVFLLAGAFLPAQKAEQNPEQNPPRKKTFQEAVGSIHERLNRSVKTLGELREKVRAEQVPLVGVLGKLEAELIEVRRQYREKTLGVDRGNLHVTTLQSDRKKLEDQVAYLSHLFGQYVHEFETRLLVAEKERYEDLIQTAKLAAEDENRLPREVYRIQAKVVAKSIDRLEQALGGALFQGKAVDQDGVVTDGMFAVVGPATIFRSDDGGVVGTAEQRMNSAMPVIVPFVRRGDIASAASLIDTGSGDFPVDPTLGNANKMQATEEPLLDHIKKGGPVMVPIFVMAGLALLVTLYKWITMLLLRRPSKKRMADLLDAVARGDREDAQSAALAMDGPPGAMLAVGAAHMSEPRELIEEVMYESVITHRLRVQRFLPFIAICAASAPLLGLLGTVTGIINTFKLITVFGSGDVKMLSGGISEALITTKFGLIVAIPSLLLHAYLSRKARGIIGTMERAAVTFLNQVEKSRPVEFASSRVESRSALPEYVVEPNGNNTAPDPELVRLQVGRILEDMLAPLSSERPSRADGRNPASEVKPA